MLYTVIWQPNAENRLAQIWLDADDRSVVTEAANEIDGRHRNDPKSFGESRSGRTRVAVSRHWPFISMIRTKIGVVSVLAIRNISSPPRR